MLYTANILRQSTVQLMGSIAFGLDQDLKWAKCRIYSMDFYGIKAQSGTKLWVIATGKTLYIM